MSTLSSKPEAQAELSTPVPVIVQLSGEHRGTTLRLHGDRLDIGTALGAEIRLPTGAASVAEHHAHLERRGTSYEIEAAEGELVWVNGEPVERLTLASGDLLEIGHGGPTLRFRLYPPGSPAYKTVMEAFSDCFECALDSTAAPLGRAANLIGGLPRELATQTGPWTRITVSILLALLISSTAYLALRGLRLEERLTEESNRLGGIAELIRSSESRFLTVEDLEGVQTELATELGEARHRLEALESRSKASSRIIATASRSVIFLQGAYGFIEPESGHPLRFAGLDQEGRPLLNENGEPAVTLDGSGPPVESLYTGTAFVAGPNGLLMTNRHVAVPWDFDESALQLQARGLVPVMHRFVGYLPGVAEPFDVELVAASDDADVALLRCRGVTGTVPPLLLAEKPPAAGDEVLVLGYPAGMRALLARAERSFVDQMLTAGGADFWSVAGKLAEGGHIRPLASRGIVGQVTLAAVVYDAETTQGGSGGPVLDLDGRVIAVNAAILPEFGGSNLGVPAARGRVLMNAPETAGAETPPVTPP